jgi:hypothetical protein
MQQASQSAQLARDPGEPLFLPHDNDDALPQSGRIVASQREIMELSGMGDVDADQLLGELEDAEEEDARELDSQQLAAGQGGLVLDQTVGDLASIPLQRGTPGWPDSRSEAIVPDEEAFDEEMPATQEPKASDGMDRDITDWQARGFSLFND